MILHFADIHFDQATKNQVLPALDFISNVAKDITPAKIIFAGDAATNHSISNEQSVELRTFFLKLAEVADVYLIPGNHDQFSGQPFNFLNGILSTKDGASVSNRIHIISSPKLEYWDELKLQVLFLGYPNKYVLNKTPQELTEDLKTILLSFRPQIKKKSITVYHGNILGGQYDQDSGYMPSSDVVLSPADFISKVVLAGHLHKSQDVQGVVYSGSVAPLTFNETHISPCMLLWKPDFSSYEKISIPVAHQLIDIVINEVEGSNINQYIEKVIREESNPRSKIRLILNLPREKLHSIDRKKLNSFLSDNVFAGQIEYRPVEIGSIRISQFKQTQLSIPESIEIYLKHFDKTHHSDNIMNLNDYIEKRTSPEKSIKGFSTISLKWKNFKQLKEGVVDFTTLGNITSISGENTAGKSNFLDIEGFLYWKRTSKNDLPSSVITSGESECEIEGEFSSGEEVYKVCRRVTKSKTDFGFYKRNNGDWVSLNEGTAVDTQRKLEGIVGTYDLYRLTSFSSQFDIERLTEIKPADFKSLLYSIININKYLERRDIAAKLLKDVESKAIEAETGLKFLQEREEECQLSGDDEALIKKETPLKEQLKKETEKIAKDAGNKEAYNAIIQQGQSINDKLVQIDKKINIPYTAEEIQGNVQFIQKFLLSTQSLSALSSQRELVLSNIFEIERKRELLSTIPCSKDLAEKCRFSKEAADPKLEVELIELKKSLAEMDKKFKVSDSAIKKNNNRYQKIKDMDWDTLSSDLSRYLNLESEKEVLGKEIEGLRKRCKEIKDNLMSDAQRNKLENVISDIQDNLLSIARAQSKKDELSSIKTKIVEINNTVNELTLKKEIVSLYCDMMGRGGIPYFLVEHIVPTMEDYINKFLENNVSPLKVRCKTIKELKSGEERDEIFITFLDKRGEFALNNASGFQKAVLGISIRAALAKIQSLYKGIQLTQFVTDEGWGVLHDKNMLVAKEVISHVAKEFDRYLYVTHIEAIRNFADTILTIKQVGDYSYLESE